MVRWKRGEEKLDDREKKELPHNIAHLSLS